MRDPIRIAVGEGTPEGTNSAYFLPDAGALIDPGPPSERAWTDIRDGIIDAGYDIETIDHVFVTHWHADHAGLSCRLAARADATVHLHSRDAPLVGSYKKFRERRIQRDRRTLERWGVPCSIRNTVIDGDLPSPLPASFPVSSHRDGDSVEGIEFVHTPGHTAGHTSFRTDDQLFLGDLLLPTYTPNVGGSDTRLTDALGAYLRSLRRVESTRRVAHPGHGTTIDIKTAIASTREHHRERAVAAFNVIRAAESPSTPWEVAKELFGEMAGIHAKFGAGEAAAHLSRLTDLNIVKRTGESPDRFRPVIDSYTGDRPLVR